MFPRRPLRLQLGVGLDLPWGRDPGFVHDGVRGDVVSPRAAAFLREHAGEFEHLFASWQPRDRSELEARHYFPAFDHLFGRVGNRFAIKSLHQTALNLGALEPYQRGPLLELTSALVERYDLAWVNEDLGLWSIHGKPLPYPLAPYLTADGLAAAIRNTHEAARALAVPLLIEFPGFPDGAALTIGPMHAYDFFRRVADEADVAVTLDTGHLLSYQWRRGACLFDELERLPLERCFEVHLSGCEIRQGRFFDRHHGILLQEQIELCKILLALCPNLRAVTYEDPALDETGAIAAAAAGGLAALRRAVEERRGH